MIDEIEELSSKLIIFIEPPNWPQFFFTVQCIILEPNVHQFYWTQNLQRFYYTIQLVHYINFFVSQNCIVLKLGKTREYKGSVLDIMKYLGTLGDH